MHQIQFCLGSAPDPAGGVYRSPDLLLLFKGLFLMQGRGMVENGTVGEKEGEEMKRNGRGGDPKGWFTPHVRNPKNTDTLIAELI